MNLYVLKVWLQATTDHAERERGASMVEYILLVSLIAVAVMSAVLFFRGRLTTSFSESGSKLSNLP